MKILYLFISFILILNVSAKNISIKASNNNDLEFGTIVTGDGPTLIIPSTSDTPQNALFLISGDKNMAYTIILPASMTISNGVTTLTVNNFQSYPAEGANGLIGASGKQDLLVGATLELVPISATSGSYSGSFSVEVVY